MPGAYKSQRAAMLRYMNRYVELAKLPPEQQQARFQQLETTLKDQPVLVRMLVPTLSKLSDAARRSQAQLCTAIAAVAAERYRRCQGAVARWFDVLKEAIIVRAFRLTPTTVILSAGTGWTTAPMSMRLAPTAWTMAENGSPESNPPVPISAFVCGTWPCAGQSPAPLPPPGINEGGVR